MPSMQKKGPIIAILVENSVRWSEILRLPYFDLIRFVVVDPMHCLFLGIAKWITKRIWIDEGVLTEKDLQSIQKKMDEFKVPSDLGQIPGKIHCGEGFLALPLTNDATFS
ncbi:hypothetical protein RIR_jg18675.t4 [Rhizophagus irregularis DAOM 181602=DAOM 197198]|nr:hypothetical protein RIR_jg18675.t4 [Rhizophagus irregularis DAOM 181602=DAOM 197198]